MPITGAQTILFFEAPDQMGIPNATVVQLAQEGITTVDSLVDFDKATIEQIAANLRRPAGRIPDPNPGAAIGGTIATPPFVFGAKSQQRLVHAANLVRFYTTVGRSITAVNLQWNPTLKNFSEQWKALEDKKKDDEPEVPKINKALPIIRWTEAFADYAHRCCGTRTAPLAYVIRPEAATPMIGAQAPGAPHSTEHGLVEAELIARASHGHPLFREDNSAVYYKLEEATRGTSYAASIKPFQRTKNGRAAWLALSSQYAGKDKWEAEIKRHEQLMHTREWKGQSNFSLERFIAQHRNAYVCMQAAAEHVTYQVPNEHSRVGYLLNAIISSDAGLQAAMASVKTDQTPNGLRNNFEATATHLMPYDPVMNKKANQSGNKRNPAEISDASGAETGANVSAFGAKKGIGSSGVHLRYHSPDEYKKLSKEEKDDLRQWRKTTGSTGKGGKESKSSPKQYNPEKAIASAVEKKFAERMKAIEKEKQGDAEAEGFIMSVFNKYTGNKVQIADATAKPPNVADYTTKKTNLRSILKKAKNG
jgi:hypothetical protein